MPALGPTTPAPPASTLTPAPAPLPSLASPAVLANVVTTTVWANGSSPSLAPVANASSPGLPIAPMVGGVVGGFVIACAAAAAWVWWGRCIKRKERKTRLQALADLATRENTRKNATSAARGSRLSAAPTVHGSAPGTGTRRKKVVFVAPALAVDGTGAEEEPAHAHAPALAYKDEAPADGVDEKFGEHELDHDRDKEEHTPAPDSDPAPAPAPKPASAAPSLVASASSLIAAPLALLRHAPARPSPLRQASSGTASPKGSPKGSPKPGPVLSPLFVTRSPNSPMGQLPSRGKKRSSERGLAVSISPPTPDPTQTTHTTSPPTSPIHSRALPPVPPAALLSARAPHLAPPLLPHQTSVATISSASVYSTQSGEDRRRSTPAALAAGAMARLSGWTRSSGSMYSTLTEAENENDRRRDSAVSADADAGEDAEVHAAAHVDEEGPLAPGRAGADDAAR